jgi:hypothetical protein
MCGFCGRTVTKLTSAKREVFARQIRQILTRCFLDSYFTLLAGLQF